MNALQALEIIKKGTVQVLPEADLVRKLEKKGKLKIKLGMDPTAPDLHLGHAVVLSKLREFQDLGHEIILIIGDFTAMIGDPSGKSKTRPPLSEEQIKLNAKTYFDQVKKILDPAKTTIRYNSEWLSAMSFSDVVKLAGKVTLARIIEREDFHTRIQNNQSIGFHELFYPIMQGYDSVVLNSDVELGGTDQTFNLLMGRFLQEQFGHEPQVILTMPLLEGLDGINKMSKSLGNYIGLTEAPQNAFGKLMSISDNLMWRYFQLLLLKTDAEIGDMKKGIQDGTLHPMNLKKEMAYGVISKFWSKHEAANAKEHFESLFQKHDYSKAQEIRLDASVKDPIWIIELLKLIGAIKSSSEGSRLVSEGAVHVEGEKIADFKANISLKDGMIIKVGKHRIYKLIKG